MDTSTALLLGLATAVPLLLGAAVGMRWSLPKPLLGGLMAFGAGTMLAAIGEDLFGPAFTHAGALVAGVALLAGAGTYVIADHVLERRLSKSAIGLGLMLGAALDGVPENAALGVSGGALSLLVAIAVGNTPEAISSAAILRRDASTSMARGLTLWAAVGAILVAVTVAAATWSELLSGKTTDVILAFAGGAVIAVLADTLMPEAYGESGWWAGAATALGFLTAFSIG
jgi:ZIP family zinc transporter